ncbi:MAG: Ldh family oxidoreductase [Alphaproteobacteria bacterium]|nr:Ldh family oxidoreductase [Alphaproteobacteria bacterium]
MAVIWHGPLRDFAEQVLAHYGVPGPDARMFADSLVQADLWGHQSHGVLRLPWYAARLETGAMRAVTAPRVDVDQGAVEVIDGGDGIGQMLAARAMDDAIARAKRSGIGAVAVRNSNHFGTAMYFTRRAAAAGCIGVLTTNASPAMAPWGGTEKRVGNNPWSIAAPGGPLGPVVLDIANTAVARGKLYLAKQRGEDIPPGWATDGAGRPTTDPAAGIAGLILPMGGHKGYAISVMMDVLSGVLTGGGFLDGVAGPYQAERRSGAGHLALALDIAAFRPLDEFLADMARLIDGLKSVPVAEGSAGVFYPGEIEALNDTENRRNGLILPEDTLADLKKLAESTGIPAPLFD